MYAVTESVQNEIIFLPSDLDGGIYMKYIPNFGQKD